MVPGEQAGGGDDTGAATPPEAETFGSGRYVVKQLLGEGTQKTVYLVHDTTLGRDCALSLLKTGLLQADDLARLRREAQTMARLTHGNIVTVHDISEEAEERPYIVSEYVSAGDLRQELREAGGPLALRRAVAIAKDLCRALAVAHGRGVIHRDLRPENIWLAEDGSAKLGDFAVSLETDRSRLTMTGTLRTAAYLAPEQAQGQEVTARSDLYSLGCVLYELLTGRPPFEGDDPMAVVSQHVHAQPPPPRERNAAVPESLERLVLRLLAKEPEARPASAEEVLAELERVDVAPPATERWRPARDLARLLPRPPLRVVAAVLLLAAVGGGVAGAVVYSGGGGETVVATTTVEYSVFFQGPGQLVSGDCITEDAVLRFTTEDEVTGDTSGRAVTTIDVTLYVAQECREGLVSFSSTTTDPHGNSLSSVAESPVSVSGTASSAELDVAIIGGSGIYEGATGHGSCTSTSETQDNGQPVDSVLELGEADLFLTGRADCRLELTTDGPIEADEP